MTRWKCHLAQLSWIPSRHYQSSAVRIPFYFVDDKLELVNSFPFVIFVEGGIWRIPISPLKTINWAEIPSFSIDTNAI